MEQYGKNSVEFDYTNFLGAACNKRWTFAEALTTIAPVFSIVWKSQIAELETAEDRLWDTALKEMSTRRSDESNLVTLLRLAQTEGIDELKVIMPYALEPKQIEYIQQHTGACIQDHAEEAITVQLACHEVQ